MFVSVFVGELAAKEGINGKRGKFPFSGQQTHPPRPATAAWMAQRPLHQMAIQPQHPPLYSDSLDFAKQAPKVREALQTPSGFLI